MYRIRRKLFSQNFLWNRKLVNQLLERTSIGKTDLVLEIGPGNGIITEQLVAMSNHVLAVEIDAQYCRVLKQKFETQENLTIFNEDILNFRLPGFPYKVFSNIPFSIEGKIIRKLIDSKNPPDDCSLVMMKELAYRLSAPYKENLFSILHKPWFEFSVVHHFQRTDFMPAPNVDAVLLNVTKRKNPLIPNSQKDRYQTFVKLGFGHGLPVYRNLKKQYDRQSVRHALHTIGINKNSIPGHFSLEQWMRLFEDLHSSLGYKI